jgi:hypothetical protein
MARTRRLCDRVVDGEAAVFQKLSGARVVVSSSASSRRGVSVSIQESAFDCPCVMEAVRHTGRGRTVIVGSASGGLPLVAVPAPLAVRRQLTDVRIVARVLVVALYLVAVLLGRRFPVRAVPLPLTVG